MASLNDIRSLYLDYFAKNGHEKVQSAPLVPQNDPTLLFVNAGMVPFKNVFTGLEKRPYNRAVSSQKCVRAGGKHNDLDNVGYTARHHTFFEMLGNFSFGDYFKDMAIELAWNLVTKEMGLNKDKLLVTIYHDDEQAYSAWKKVAGLPDEKIIRIATTDNFWSMGDTGPCGPCSEIFYDHGEHIAGGPPGSPDEDGDRFIEIWNLVFMQFEQLAGGERINLPKPSIDTGMGLERVTNVLQGVHDNFDIDLFKNLIAASVDLTGKKAEGEAKFSHRIIADHLRASSFLLADGVMPSNEGRGYVLRRIMRRAMRHAHILGCKEPLMYKLVPALAREMGGAYPELIRAQAMITETLKLEEEKFRETLDRGLKLLEDEISRTPSGGVMKGEVAFKLYDTYGFPLDLTADILRGRNLKLDEKGYNDAMQKQKAEARKNWSGSGEKATDTLWFEIKEKVGVTEFIGYSTNNAAAMVVAIVKDGKQVDKASKGDKIAFITNQTPFYGESGGQVGDIGTASNIAGFKAEVFDTKKVFGDLIVHHATIVAGELKQGDSINLSIDNEYRLKLRANHSATHILHKVLREILGEHVTQKGSLVSAESFRFDFSHNKAVSSDELTQIEDRVNAYIIQNSEVKTKITTPDNAVKEGAMALFGEKYGDEVRVVSMGDSDDGKRYSVELCGGTHVNATGDIGLFKIVSESSVASGVRRIEAKTGKAAIEHVRAYEKLAYSISGLLKSSIAEVNSRVSALVDEKKKLEKEVQDLKRKLASGGGGALSGSCASAGNDNAGLENINGVSFVARKVNLPAKDLRGVADEITKDKKTTIAAIFTDYEDKVGFVIKVSNDLTDRYSAIDFARSASESLGGKGGGGRPDMAQGGGANVAAIDDAINSLRGMIGK